MDFVEKSPCGRYVRFKEILGFGAFKDVYKGFDNIDRKEVAWNQILIEDKDVFRSPEKLESLCSEAVLLESLLGHKNIMKCYSHWVDVKNKTFNMITELFASGSLKDYRTKKQEVDAYTIKKFGRKILQGVCYLHGLENPIIHRDLKCDNIFLDDEGEVIIGDFGLAKVTTAGRPESSTAGTPEFMAPEFYVEEYNELVDIYAFGMCMLQLVTGEYPYRECHNAAQIFKKVYTGVKPMSIGKVKDPKVKQFIEKCLVPASMRPSALELLKDPFLSLEIINYNNKPKKEVLNWSLICGYSMIKMKEKEKALERAIKGWNPINMFAL